MYSLVRSSYCPTAKSRQSTSKQAKTPTSISCKAQHSNEAQGSVESPTMSTQASKLGTRICNTAMVATHTSAQPITNTTLHSSYQTKHSTALPCEDWICCHAARLYSAAHRRWFSRPSRPGVLTEQRAQSCCPGDKPSCVCALQTLQQRTTRAASRANAYQQPHLYITKGP